MSFEQEFFRYNKNYGPNIAEAYRKFTESNPLKSGASLRERADYLSRFCASQGLDSTEVFFDIEQARQEEQLKAQRRAAMVAIMVRGGGAAMDPTARQRIERRIREHGKSD